jgi:hypothetical protein
MFSRICRKMQSLRRPKFLEFRIRTISEKMPQDIAALAPIQHEIQFRLGDVASQRVKKLAPGIAMRSMTADEDSIHVKDDTAHWRALTKSIRATYDGVETRGLLDEARQSLTSRLAVTGPNLPGQVT